MYMIFTKSQKEKDHLDSTEDYRMEFQETLEGSSLVFGCLFSRTARWNNQQPVKSGNTFHATQPFLFELCDTNCFLDSKGSTANWSRQATDALPELEGRRALVPHPLLAAKRAAQPSHDA